MYANCDYKLVGTRVYPVSSGVVDVACYFILISREIHYTARYTILEIGMDAWEGVATWDRYILATYCCVVAWGASA